MGAVFPAGSLSKGMEEAFALCSLALAFLAHSIPSLVLEPASSGFQHTQKTCLQGLSNYEILGLFLHS